MFIIEFEHKSLKIFTVYDYIVYYTYSIYYTYSGSLWLLNIRMRTDKKAKKKKLKILKLVCIHIYIYY